MTFHDSPCYEKHRAACSVPNPVISFDAFGSDGNHESPEPKSSSHAAGPSPVRESVINERTEDAIGSMSSMNQVVTLTSDRPVVVPRRLGPGTAKEQIIRVGYKHRPIRDGGGKLSDGRLSPPLRLPKLCNIGSTILQVILIYIPCMFDNLADPNMKEHPFPEAFLTEVRGVLAPADLWGVDDGQPFHLRALSHLASLAGDPDWEFPLSIAPGVPLGVD